MRWPTISILKSAGSGAEGRASASCAGASRWRTAPTPQRALTWTSAWSCAAYSVTLSLGMVTDRLCRCFAVGRRGLPPGVGQRCPGRAGDQPPSGSGPKRLAPGVPFSTPLHQIAHSQPITGTSTVSTHQPLWSRSCQR